MNKTFILWIILILTAESINSQTRFNNPLEPEKEKLISVCNSELLNYLIHRSVDYCKIIGDSVSIYRKHWILYKYGIEDDVENKVLTLKLNEKLGIVERHHNISLQLIEICDENIIFEVEMHHTFGGETTEMKDVFLELKCK